MCSHMQSSEMSRINIHSADGVCATLYSDDEWDVLNHMNIDITVRFDIITAMSDGYEQLSSMCHPITSYFDEMVAAHVSPPALDALRRVVLTSVDRPIAIEVIKFMRLRETRDSLHTYGAVNRHGVMVGTEEQYASKRWTILPEIRLELHIWLASRLIARESHDDAKRVHPGARMYTWDEQTVELLFIMLHAKRARSRAGHFGGEFSENCRSDVILSVLENDESSDATEMFFGDVEYAHHAQQNVASSIADPATDWGIGPTEKRQGTRRRKGKKKPKGDKVKRSSEDDGKPHAEEEDGKPHAEATMEILCQICYEYIPIPEMAPKECDCNLFAHVACIAMWNSERERTGLSRKTCMVC